MNLFNLFLIFMCILKCEAKHLSRTNTSGKSERIHFKHPSRSCETSKMDVHLTELSRFFPDRENEGFIDITLPTSGRRPLFVCFPLYFQQYRQTYLLAHAACRQLGYGTATSIVGKRIPTDSFVEEVLEDDVVPTPLPLPLPKGLSPVSWKCAGHEQNIAQCVWNNIRLEGCQMLTELTCGECQRSVKAQHGFLKSPGYPAAHFYDMTCEWRIEVPESHFIRLLFHSSLVPSERHSEFHCPTDRPYVDIAYGVQGSYHMRRYCDFKRLQNLTISHHKVQIRFFSGLYNPRGINIHNNEQGIAISFKALSNEPHSLTMDVIAVVSIILFGLAAVIFFIRKTICSRMKHERAVVGAEESAPNVPGREDLDKAYEFQRCQIQPGVHNKQGLRLRSNGSGTKMPSFRFQESKISNQIYTTFRKFSSNTLTPRTIIPASLKSSQSRRAKLQAIVNLKANLLDRYSSGSNSNRKDSVFFPATKPAFDFPIYHSTSSESRQDLPMIRIPPQETAI